MSKRLTFREPRSGIKASLKGLGARAKSLLINKSLAKELSSMHSKGSAIVSGGEKICEVESLK